MSAIDFSSEAEDVPSLFPDRAAVFGYLFELQESGKTNMLGATPYLQEKFNIDASEARSFLTEYMSNYSALRAQYAPAPAAAADGASSEAPPAPKKLTAAERSAAKAAEREAKKAAKAAAKAAEPKKPRGRPRKAPAADAGAPILEAPAEPKKPRGRPRKTPDLAVLLAELTELRAQMATIQSAYAEANAKLEAVKSLLNV